MKVLVLGGGPTGEHFVGALRRFDEDAELTLVESRLVGGECSYYACMPTKTMLRAAEISATLDRSPGFEPQRPDIERVWWWRDQVTSNWDDTGQLDFSSGKIDVRCSDPQVFFRFGCARSALPKIGDGRVFAEQIINSRRRRLRIEPEVERRMRLRIDINEPDALARAGQRRT